jgi:FkbM family methyltransferase
MIEKEVMNGKNANGRPLTDRLRHIADAARRLEDQGSLPRRSTPAPSKPIVLYGAGPLGQMTVAHLQQIGISPVALVDGNHRRWGTALGGIGIISPADAVRRYAETAQFVVTIYNGSAVRRQLAELGCAHVMHFSDLFFDHAEEFLPFCGLAPSSVVLDAWTQVEVAAHSWFDERSTAEYMAQLALRLRLPNAEMPKHDAPEQCYFPDGLFTFLEHEVFFDCGAFDGDSVRQYLGRRPSGGSSKVIAFEPDAATFVRLRDYVRHLPTSIGADIRVEPWAVADKSGTVRFSALGSVRSGVQESGGASVEAVALDDIGILPTLIKMDVEGFELPALKGASALLRRQKPVLAISMYHHASDLWTIPNFLKTVVPDYNLFLRRYAEDCWELVLYAIPASRMPAAGAPRSTDLVTS